MCLLGKFAVLHLSEFVYYDMGTISSPIIVPYPYRTCGEWRRSWGNSTTWTEKLPMALTWRAQRKTTINSTTRTRFLIVCVKKSFTDTLGRGVLG